MGVEGTSMPWHIASLTEKGLRTFCLDSSSWTRSPQGGDMHPKEIWAEEEKRDTSLIPTILLEVLEKSIPALLPLPLGRASLWDICPSLV